MTTTVQNGKPQRKQLSQQLDRLDSILDGLSEGLNAAVADSTREGTRLALKDAIVEIMTDPSLRGKLHQATAPQEPLDRPAPRGSVLARLKSGLEAAAGAAGFLAARVVDRGKACMAKATQVASETFQSVRRMGNVKNLALVGLGVGGTLAVVGLIAPHAVTAGLTGLCGGIAAIAVQVGVWTRRTMRALTIV